MLHRSRLTVTTGLLSVILSFTLLASFDRLAPQSAAASTVPASPPALTARGVPTETVNTAAVVVQFDDQRSLVRNVAFTESITGLAMVQRTGLDITWAETSFGPGVCAIEGVGCPADNCFCDPNRYWGYSYWDGAAWQAYPVGVGQSVISSTGAIEGWRWGGATSLQTPATQAIAAASALTWLRSQQDVTSGGYGDGLGGAVEVLLALGANGERSVDWIAAGSRHTLADFVRLRATKFTRTGVAEAGKLAVASTAAGGCRTVRSLQPTDYYSDTLGAFAADNGFNAWGILGAVALSKTVPAAAVDALAAQMVPTGGWEWQAGFGADTNTTALVIQTLLATGRPVTSTAIISGLAFLKSAQLEDGGIVYDPAALEFGADANSTAYTVQALMAAGVDPAGTVWTTAGGATPITFLLSLQQPDGSFAWQAGTGSNLLATTQTVTALLGRSYPITVSPLQSCAGQAK